MEDVTIPGKEQVVWDAKFRLVGPDGSLGSDYLPSSLQPIGGSHRNFEKLCSALNSVRKYVLKIDAGGNAPIDQTIAINARIVQPPDIIDPQQAVSDTGDSGAGGDAHFQKVGPRVYTVSNGAVDPPKQDTAAAVKSSSFTQREILTTINSRDGTILTRSENKTFPSVTSTSFNGSTTSCARPPPDLRNVPGCHKPPTVTIHTPKTLRIQQEYYAQRSLPAAQPMSRGFI
jgi:hypothetical protein